MLVCSDSSRQRDESCAPQHHLRDIPWSPPHAACAVETIQNHDELGLRMVQDQSIYTLRQSGPHLRPQWSKGAHGSLYSLRKGTATHHYHPSQRSKSWLPASRGLHSLLPSPGCGWRGRPSCHRPHVCTLLRKKKAVQSARRLLPAQSPRENWPPSQKQQADRNQPLPYTAQDEQLAWQGHGIPGNGTI